jgi:hypothetical protein
VGSGLLGGNLIEGLRGLGLSPSRITVVEKDATLRQQAIDAGMKALSPEELTSRKARSPRALVYVATNGTSVDESNAVAFGDETLLLGVTSAGKGVDLRGLRETHPEARASFTRVGGSARGVHYRTWNDWTFDLGERHARVTVVADALPLNLLEESWPERFAVTSSAVALATYAAGQLTGPGLVSLPSTLEDALLTETHTLGLDRPRPLDPSLFDDDRRALQRDFDTFAEPTQGTDALPMAVKRDLTAQELNGAVLGQLWITARQSTPPESVPPTGSETASAGSEATVPRPSVPAHLETEAERGPPTSGWRW